MKLVYFLFVVLLYNCNPSKDSAIDTGSQDRFSLANWRSEVLSKDSLVLNGVRLKILDTFKLNALLGKPKFKSKLINWGHYLNNANEEYINVNVYDDTEFSIRDNTVGLKKVIFFNTENVLSFGTRLSLSGKTTASEIFNLFPQSAQLVNSSGGYKWSGVVFIRTSLKKENNEVWMLLFTAGKLRMLDRVMI